MDPEFLITVNDISGVIQKVGHQYKVEDDPAGKDQDGEEHGKILASFTPEEAADIRKISGCSIEC